MEKERTHNMLLDFIGYGIKVSFPFKKNCCSIIVPKVPKVRFNSFFQVSCDICGTSLGLVFYLFNKDEPALKLILIVIEV